MKNKKFLGTFGIVLAVVLVFIIVWAVVSGQNSDLAASSDMEELAQPQASAQTSPQNQQNEADETASQSPSAPSMRSTSSTASLTKFLHEQEDILADMFEDMRDEEPSGNASEDFLEGMIPHHEATIDMAKNYLKYGGTNPSLKALAEDIIKTRTSELQQMELLEDEIEDMNLRDEKKETEYLNTYRSILSSHSADTLSTAEDVELVFAEQMISHQQMAVDMAKGILGLTDHEQVRKLAETIIKTEENEIGQMKEQMNGD